MKQDIFSFLQPDGALFTDEKPLLTTFYGKTFNAVDMFDRYMSSISYAPRSIVALTVYS
jgi:hypothetical protein